MSIYRLRQNRDVIAHKNKDALFSYFIVDKLNDELSLPSGNSLFSFSSFVLFFFFFFFSSYSAHVIGGDCGGAGGVGSPDTVDITPAAGETAELLLAPPCRPSKLALSCPAATYENTHNIA